MMTGSAKQNGAPEIDVKARAREALRPFAPTIRSMCETSNFSEHPLYLAMVDAVVERGDAGLVVQDFNSHLTS